MWELTTGKPLGGYREPTGTNLLLAITPNGQHLVAGRSLAGLGLWRLETGELIRNFWDTQFDAEWELTVGSIAITRDGRHVASGDYYGTIRVWELTTGKLIRRFRGHVSTVNSVAFSPDGGFLVSGGSDGTMRAWQVQNGGGLAVFLHGHDGKWLTVTPQGFFDSSASTKELLEVVRGFEATSIEQVHQSLYSPDLVREWLAGDPENEFANASKVINLEKVLDSGKVPSIEIIAPGADTKSDAGLVNAAAMITDTGGGIGRIEWRVNGVTSGVNGRPKGYGSSITVKRQLALVSGKNTIEVVAYNGRNLLASPPARTTINWNAPAEISKGRLFVLAIGIDAYSDDRFRRLNLAVKDAKAFGAAIEAAGKGEYTSVHVFPMLDADATPRKLEQLIDRMARDITPRDTFMLFAAAHGTSKDGRFYLIPYGFRSNALGKLSEKAIGQDRLQKWVGNLRARNALILLDTCESGALVGGHTKSRINAPASEAAVGRLHEATGRPVLTAAATGKAALEGYPDNNGHGIFTWALLDALKNGDTNGNGVIELSELVAHVQAEVPRRAAELRGGRAPDQPERGARPVSDTGDVARYAAFRQSARFGSRGENFAVVRRLQ